MPNIDQFPIRSGRVIKEDSTVVNEANGINADGSRNVSLTGSNVKKLGEVLNVQIASGATVGLITNKSIVGCSWVRGFITHETGNTVPHQVIVSQYFTTKGANTITTEADYIATTGNPSYSKGIKIDVIAEVATVSAKNMDTVSRYFDCRLIGGQ